MASVDHSVQRVVNALGFELVRELVGRPQATEKELKRIIRAAIASAQRQIEVRLEIQPYDDESERVERILDWLKSQRGGNNTQTKS